MFTTVAFYSHYDTTKNMCTYSQHFIFFVTYEQSQLVRILHYIKLERFASDKRSNLLDLFLRYEENKVLWIHPLYILI